MVAWEIYADDVDQASEIASAIKAELKGYSWVRALGNVYVVKVENDAARAELGDGLKSVAKQYGGVHIIYSPAMAGGRYNGWLPSRLWPKIRERTEDG